MEVSMLATVLLGLSLVAAPAQTAPAGAGLPKTPQGKSVEAFFKAFNSGDEKTFLDMQEQLLSKTQLERRSRQERAEMYQKMRRNLGTLSVATVIKATPLVIQLRLRSDRDADPEFTFDFEEKAPFKITGIGVEVQVRDRG
jgi:hypothetical protein